MTQERLTYHELRETATTIIELLREEPSEQRAVLLLLDHLLVFQQRIQEMTLRVVQQEILGPLLLGIEERAADLKRKPS